MYALHQYSVKTTNKSCTLPLFPHASIFVDDRKVHVRFTTGLPGPPAAPRHASPGSGSRRHLRWQWTPPKIRTPGGWRLSAVQEVRRCKNLKDIRTIYLDLRSLPKEHTHTHIYICIPIGSQVVNFPLRKWKYLRQIQLLKVIKWYKVGIQWDKQPTTTSMNGLGKVSMKISSQECSN